MKELEHEGLPRFLAHGEVNGEPYWVQEPVEGRSLQEILENEGTLPLDEIRDLAATLGSLLVYLHQRGIHHGSLRPESIRRRDGKFFIVDLGVRVARYLDRWGRHDNETIVQAVQFNPPETRVPALRVESDQFSLAAVIYLALTGRTIHQDRFRSNEEAMKVAWVDGSEAIQPPSLFRKGVTKECDQVILRMLSFEPAARFPRTADAVQALMAALESPEPGQKAASAPPDS